MQLRRGLQTGHDLALQWREDRKSGVAVVVQQGEIVVLADAHVALALQQGLDALVLGDVADGEDDAEVQRDSFLAGGNAAVR